MKDVLCIVGLVLSLLVFNACGHSSNEVVRIVEERDSLKNVANQRQKYIENMGELINLVNSGLDSITAEENMIFPSISEKGYSKDAMLSKVDNIAKLIANQKEEIAKLEKRLADDAESGVATEDDNMQRMIDRFKSQLAEKDRQIAILKNELSQKNADISNLQKKIGSYSQAIAELDRKNAMQTEALKRQDAMLNHCYMIVADKKTLQNSGIVKKGKLVAQGALDRSKFARVDIRSFTEMEFDAKHPRILTPMPEGSYTLTTNGKNHYSLKINNPSEFWRISNYLVIQTN